jgi:hypothetical protein
MGDKSKLYFIQKFTKEIIRVWQECPNEIPSNINVDELSMFLDNENRQNETMSFAVMRYILLSVGFIKDT